MDEKTQQNAALVQEAATATELLNGAIRLTGASSESFKSSANEFRNSDTVKIRPLKNCSVT
jgi:hypothetical protein